MNIPGLDPRIRIIGKWADGWEVMYPVSCHYNGGPDEVVDPPVVAPPGWEFRGICIGLQLNARPPLATVLMAKKK